MVSQNEMVEIMKRVGAEGAGAAEATMDQLRADAQVLLSEVSRASEYLKTFTGNINSRLVELEADMESLEAENTRLRDLNQSTFFERDACVGLMAQMAARLGYAAGTAGNRVVIDLPAGQVSWDYLEAEAHLYESLPPYAGPVLEQTNREVYSKVMNPGFPQDS